MQREKRFRSHRKTAITFASSDRRGWTLDAVRGDHSPCGGLIMMLQKNAEDESVRDQQ
jgi:hypothetical protein